MRKKILVPCIFLCLILIPCAQTIAWSNSSYANNSSNYNYNLHYGTHDWIAQRALEMLIEDNYTKWKWLEDRERIFLTGTEAPDNSNLAMILDDELVQGYGDFENHHVLQISKNDGRHPGRLVLIK